MCGDLGLYVGSASLVLAAVAIWLAWQTTRQLNRIENVADNLHETTSTIRSDVGALQEEQRVQLDKLFGGIEGFDEILGDVLRRLDGVEPAQPPRTPAQAVEEFERMKAISLDQLDDDIRAGVQRVAGVDPDWALRRRGPGRPRWLVGAHDRYWRVTRREGGPSFEELEQLDYRVEPLHLHDLPSEAQERLASAAGIEVADIDPTLFRRVARGVPVYYGFAPTGRSGSTQVWRLVKNRWGWNAVPEE